MLISVMFIILGFIFLIKGADFLVEGASNLAKKFHIPEIIIGLTIISIGTSMPELFVSITSSIGGYSDMAIGNVIGSNIVNLLFILGISAWLNPIEVKKETKFIEIPLCLFITVIFMITCNIKHGISRAEGIFLILLFIMFIFYTIFMARKENKEENIEEEESKTSLFKDILSIIIGIVALKAGGDLTVKYAVKVAEFFNVSE